MSKQLYDNGDVIQAGGNALECSGVTYQELEGEKQGFAYIFRTKADMDQERAEAAAAQKAAEVAAKETEKLTAGAETPEGQE